MSEVVRRRRVIEEWVEGSGLSGLEETVEETEEECDEDAPVETDSSKRKTTKRAR